jgi:hypothetical protein
MRPTLHLLHHKLRLTLFTHAQCSLCIPFKDVLAKVWAKRAFEYVEVDIKAKGNEKWKGLYEFDIPVLHVERDDGEGKGEISAKARKLKHRVTEGEVVGVMDEVERG